MTREPSVPSVPTCPIAQSQLERILAVAGRLDGCRVELYDLEDRWLASADAASNVRPRESEAPVVVREETVATVRAGDPVAAEVAAKWIGDLWNGATEVDNLAGEIVHAYEELHLLYELGESLTSELSVDDVVTFVLEKIVAALDAAGAELYLNDGAVRVYTRPGDRPGFGDGGAPPADSGFESIQSDHLLTTTLRSGGQSVGSILVGRRPEAAAFSSMDGKLLDAVGTLAANAIRGAQLHEEARRHAMALRESETYLRAVMDNVADGIVTLDDGGEVRSFNPAAQHVFGYTAEEVVGQHVAMLLPPAQAGLLDSVLGWPPGAAGHRSPSGERREALGRRKDGTIFSMDVAIGEMNLDAARVTIMSVRDITERKHAERLLEHQALTTA